MCVIVSLRQQRRSSNGRGWQDQGVQSLFPAAPNELSDDDLAEVYAYPAETAWLRTNFVTTLDGAAQGSDHRAASISGAADQQIFALLRSLCDVIVVGANTTRVEGYQPVQPSEMRSELRAALGLAPFPAIAVISRSLSLDPGLVHGGEAPTIVVTTESAAATAGATLGEDVPLVAAGEQEVDLPAALEALVALGYQRMLCEGGPTLMRELVAAGCVDDLCLTISPLLSAGDRLRITHGAALEPPAHLRLRHLLEADGYLFSRYTSS
jgi:riboflavin biosynthesis pyrimidine reductase